MTIYSFLDDYSEGCHPEILAALAETNLSQQAAYGNDDYTINARGLVATACGRPEVPVYFVGGGTLANLIICAAVLRSHEAVIAATSGHIAQRETGAIEATGHKIITMPSSDGKLTPADVEAAVATNAAFPHVTRPRLVYVSNSTELGTVYSRDEMIALREACDAHGLLLLVDGARLGVALESSHAGGLDLARLTELADIFWIGGTKAGTLFGEAIVIPNSDLADDFDFHLKQRGALLAKGRALGVQFETLFTDSLFARASAIANSGARALAEGIRATGYEMAAETQSNQVFPVLPNAVVAALREEFAFHPWEARDNDHSVVRLVTSWATVPAQIERFSAVIANAG